MKYLICVASLLVAAVLPASAGSTTYSYTSNVVGVKGETVTASFTFNTTKDQFTGVSLQFKGGVFGGVTESFTKAVSGFVFSLSTSPAKGDLLLYSIAINPLNLSQFAAGGTISSLKGSGAFGYSGSRYSAVPEGGSRFAYLAPAGLALFGGMLVNGFFRRRVGMQARV